MRRCSPRTLVASLLLVATIVTSEQVMGADDAVIASRIKRIPVESRALAAVGYSKRLRALEIEFRKGAVYRYRNVAPHVYTALMEAPSKARYYHENIRGKYRSQHVRPRPK